ncbi:MAG: VOC family protein [Chloroflexi bacterium]|nr:VOC family protein [Chloroflexota bacterium]
MSLFNRMEVVSYNVTNWQRAVKFYSETLGLPVTWSSEEAGWAQFGRDGETQIAINLWRGPDPVPSREGGATVIFAVDDARKTVVELRKRGVKCDDAVEIPGMVTYATFFDPEGNRIQIAQSPQAAG